MNQATRTAVEFMVGQMDGLSLIYNDDILRPEVWTLYQVYDYYERACEDWPENYDEDFYSLFYLDKRSRCIDWNAVLDAVQHERDELYLELLFE